MRVLLSTYGSRGDVEPLVGLAVRLRALGAQVRVCAPPDEEFARLLAGVGVPLVPIGPPMGSMAPPASATQASRRVSELAALYDPVAAAAEGCDALVATGLAHFASRSVAEKSGIPYVYATFCPFLLPSPHHAPPSQVLPGRPLPPDVTDNRVLWDLNARSFNALHGEALNAHRASIGLPRVDDVRSFIFTDRPWLAADATLGPWQETSELDVVHTGAWILPDERPLPDDVMAFLAAGAPPVYVGFGSVRRVSPDLARVAIEAIRAQGRRALVGRGWAQLSPIDDRDDCFVVGEVNQQELFGRVAAVVHHGGAGTTTTAARAGAPQVVVPQAGDQLYWAARVADLGIGAAHDGPTPTTETLSAALRTALTTETRARASAVAGTIRTDGATVAATLLLDAIGRERPPGSPVLVPVPVCSGEDGSVDHDGRRHRELRSENEYVSGLYDRLDSQRALAAGRLREVHLRAKGGTAQARLERDALEFHHTRRLSHLNAAEYGLCFGRIEGADGERRYIGRTALADDEHEPILIDWRAAAAEPFYRATPAAPGGVVARRHLRSKGRTIVDFDDDAFGVGALDGRDSSELSGEAALLASLTAARTGRMGDIVSTIQAEQDRVIRSELDGVLVVQGGPGTGKTVVALHRAAYLLYTHRDRLAKRGVLVIGPNTTFLRYIDQVLPALGESEVVLSSIGALYPGVTGIDTETTEAAAIKGDARMARVLAAALDGLRQLPETSWSITVDRTSSYRGKLEISRALGERAHAAARRTGEPHNPARPDLVERLSAELALRIARDQGGEMDLDAVANLADELVAEPEFQALAEKLWPLLSPQQLLATLFGSPELLATAMPDFSEAERAALRREHPGTNGAAAVWTVADVPLLDEAAELLGPLPGGTTSRRDQVAAEAEAEDLEFAKVVLEDFGEGLAEIDAEMLTRQYRGDNSLRSLAERAIEDRTWGFGHVIVDEAQELSPMDWRLLTRRCPGRSMTIVGDLAQTGAPAGLGSWGEALDEYTAGRWRTVELTINYRTPAEIMRITEGVLRALDPAITAPTAVRSGGIRPWSLRIPENDRGSALRAAVEKEIAALDGGRMAIIHAPVAHAPAWSAELIDGLAGLAGVAVAADDPAALDSPAVLMTAAQAKGLEFDVVLVLEPAEILAAHVRGVNDLYVALTRATKNLGVIHSRELPEMLEGLDPRAGTIIGAA